MSLKKIIVSAVVISAGLLSINAVYKGEPKDGLDKRIFTVIVTEVKENAPGKKGVQDEMEFKKGKFYSDLLDEKFMYKWMSYDIKKDSTFTDEEQNEVHWIEGEISKTDDQDQTVTITCTVEDYNIQGEIKITKKDKLKKKFEFTGKEKAKKGKK